MQDEEEAIGRATITKQKRRGIKQVLRVGFEPTRPKPHELESCPLDHSGIVAASDRNGAFQLNLYPSWSRVTLAFE